MKKRRKSSARKRASVGIALCFAAAVVIAGTYTLTNYDRTSSKEEQEDTESTNQAEKVKVRSANTDKLIIDMDDRDEEDAADETKKETSDEPKERETSGAAATAVSGTGTSYHFTEDSELLWPVNGQVLMNYSMDKTVYFATLDQFKYNPALIIAGAEGDQVIAGAAGLVKSIDVTAQTGTTVNLDLGNGYELLIGQLKEVPLHVGETVNANTVVGYVSKPTKYYSVEGCNVYYAMKKDGQPVDPVLYMGE